MMSIYNVQHDTILDHMTIIIEEDTSNIDQLKTHEVGTIREELDEVTMTVQKTDDIDLQKFQKWVQLKMKEFVTYWQC